MKKTISFILALLIALSFVACGDSSTKSNNKKIKEMLIGGEFWYKDDKFSSDHPYRAIYQFHEDNTYEEHLVDINYNLSQYGHTIITGTYSINEDFIVLKKEKWQQSELNYKTLKTTDSQLDYSDEEDDNIPYYINEYTKELVFYVDRNGDSKYHSNSGKYSSLDGAIKSYYSSKGIKIP